MKILSILPTITLLIFWNLSQANADHNRYNDRYEDITSSEHGAISGDNIDDSSAIISAINAAKTQSKIVFIPAGDFTISKEINIVGIEYSQIKIQGVGYSSTIHHVGGDYAFRVGNGQVSTEGVSFENFRILSENSSASGGLLYDYANRASVNDMRIYGYTGADSAAIKYNRTWIHAIKNSSFKNNRTAIRTSGIDVNALTIDTNTIENFTDFGIYLDNVTQANIVNNTIESHAMDYGIYCKTACRSININNNYFEGGIDGNPADPVVHIGNSATNYGINITGNFMAPTNKNYFITILNAQGGTILGNTFQYQPNIGGAYIGLARALYVREFTVQGNFARPDPNWDDINYIEIFDVDGSSVPVSKQTLYTGSFYDIKTKSHIIGEKDIRTKY